MKRIAKRMYRLTVSALICILFAALLGGCFGSTKTVRVTVVEDDTAEKTYNVAIGQESNHAFFTLPLREGYYCMGLYSEKEGGEAYTDAYGMSVGPWREAYPTILYPHWGTLSELKAVGSGDSSSFSWTTQWKCKLTSGFYTALQGNPAAKIKVTATFSVSDTSSASWSVLIADSSTKTTSGGYDSAQIVGVGPFAVTATRILYVPAEAVSLNVNYYAEDFAGYFYLRFNRGNRAGTGTVSNLTWTAEYAG
ncbi:MAG: hypothetical protein LBM78_04595, partial [Clostridiales bacterium]|nr:hypothetical protein [Clostridiales bacterium]